MVAIAEYDRIGINYAELRRPDPRIAAAIEQGLGPAAKVLNVGAGTGSYERWPGPVRIAPLPVPHDCSDGFLYAYWRRPEAYLDPHVRSGSSSSWAIGEIASGLERLKRDLETGKWARRRAALLALDAYDAGYRLVIAD